LPPLPGCDIQKNMGVTGVNPVNNRLRRACAVNETGKTEPRRLDEHPKRWPYEPMKIEVFTYRWWMTQALGAIAGGTTLFLLAVWDPETAILAKAGVAMAMTGALLGLAMTAIRTVGATSGDR